MNEQIIKDIDIAIMKNRVMRRSYDDEFHKDYFRENNDLLGRVRTILKSQKEYERGMNDIWEAMRKLIKHESEGGYSIEDTLEIVGHNNRSAEAVINRLSPEEVLARIAEFDKKKEEEAAKPVLGDVVEFDNGPFGYSKGIYVKETETTHNILTREGFLMLLQKSENPEITKTGEHIDIQGMLDKIG